MNVFLVQLSLGDYSDWTLNTIGIFSTLEQAKAACMEDLAREQRWGEYCIVEIAVDSGSAPLNEWTLDAYSPEEGWKADPIPDRQQFPEGLPVVGR